MHHYVSLFDRVLKKRFPLAISRGVRYDSTNVFIQITEGSFSGIGEAAPGTSEGAGTPEEVRQELNRFLETNPESLSVYQAFDRAREMKVAPSAYAAYDIARWDLLAKKAQMPIYKMLGLSLPTAATSMTIGINTPEVVRERIPLLMNDMPSLKGLKIKLGSPEGIDADKVMFEEVVRSASPYHLKLRVDANGGWSLENAKHMLDWLAKRGVEYIEQPLVEGAEDELPELFKNRPMPIFVDESCRSANQIHRYADCVDGVNMKLMKCGGITGALEIIQVARSYGLKTMIGCMSESSISIAAAASLTGIIDHVDLDSHYNLAPDVAEGAPLMEGITMPTDGFGHGARLKPEQ
jgi:L-alanine-DL-glutamate epimerase-like enolase superfamily enzyme